MLECQPEKLMYKSDVIFHFVENDKFPWKSDVMTKNDFLIKIQQDFQIGFNRNKQILPPVYIISVWFSWALQ